MRILNTIMQKTDSKGVLHTLADIRRNDGHRMIAWLTTCDGETAINRDLTDAFAPQAAFERELNAYVEKHQLTLLN